MKLSELKFYLDFAKGMSAVTDFICGVIENYDENNSSLYITDDWLNNIKSSLGTSLGSVLKEENNANKELISGFANMVDIISRGNLEPTIMEHLTRASIVIVPSICDGDTLAFPSGTNEFYQ